MKRRDFIKGLSAACLGAALVRDSLELEPSNALSSIAPLEVKFSSRGVSANDIIADEFASIPRDIFENVVASFAAS